MFKEGKFYSIKRYSGETNPEFGERANFIISFDKGDEEVEKYSFHHVNKIYKAHEYSEETEEKLQDLRDIYGKINIVKTVAEKHKALEYMPHEEPVGMELKNIEFYNPNSFYPTVKSVDRRILRQAIYNPVRMKILAILFFLSYFQDPALVFIRDTEVYYSQKKHPFMDLIANQNPHIQFVYSIKFWNNEIQSSKARNLIYSNEYKAREDAFLICFDNTYQRDWKTFVSCFIRCDIRSRLLVPNGYKGNPICIPWSDFFGNSYFIWTDKQNGSDINTNKINYITKINQIQREIGYDSIFEKSVLGENKVFDEILPKGTGLKPSKPEYLYEKIARRVLGSLVKIPRNTIFHENGYRWFLKDVFKEQKGASVETPVKYNEVSGIIGIHKEYKLASYKSSDFEGLRTALKLNSEGIEIDDENTIKYDIIFFNKTIGECRDIQNLTNMLVEGGLLVIFDYNILSNEILSHVRFKNDLIRAVYQREPVFSQISWEKKSQDLIQYFDIIWVSDLYNYMLNPTLEFFAILKLV